MLFNVEFQQAFVFALCLIVGLAVLIGAALVVRQLIVAQSRKAIISRSEKFLRALCEVPSDVWGAGALALAIPSLVFFSVSPVFRSPGLSLRHVLGIVAAGGVIGALCAPYVGWRYRTLGPLRAIGASLLTVVGGACGSSMLVAFLISMVDD